MAILNLLLNIFGLPEILFYRDFWHSIWACNIENRHFPKTSNFQNFKKKFIVLTLVCLKNMLECKSRLKIASHTSNSLLNVWCFGENVCSGKRPTVQFYAKSKKKYSQSKLMRLDRPPAKIRSKSYSNWLLIDFCDPNLMLKSIEIVATIWIRTFISKIRSLYIKNWSKNDYYRPKMTIFDKLDQIFDINRSFLIK